MIKHTEEDIDMIKYFHEEKGDITRYANWDNIKDSVFKDFPELENALKNVESSRKIFDLVIKTLK